MLLSEEEAEEKAAAAAEEEEAAAAAEASTPLNLWWGYLPATPTPLPASSPTAAAVGGLTACVMVLTRLVSSFPTAPRSSTCSSPNRLDPDPPPPRSPGRATPPRRRRQRQQLPPIQQAGKTGAAMQAWLGWALSK